MYGSGVFISINGFSPDSVQALTTGKALRTILVDGGYCKNNTARFEYRSGAIENNNVDIGEAGERKSGMIYECGVRDQICDILEGGADAFNIRESKYSIFRIKPTSKLNCKLGKNLKIPIFITR